MHLDSYQAAAKTFARYPVDKALIYTCLGLAGEAGEVANVYKKVIRDNNGTLTEESRDKMIDELGDTLWYVSAIAGELGMSLEHLAISNIAKLEKRRSVAAFHADAGTGQA